MTSQPRKNGTDHQDELDRIVGLWAQENPGMDVETKKLSLRLRRAAQLLERVIRRELNTFDVEPWEFDLLLSLRRAPQHRKSAGTLLRESGVTSGAITNRVSRLERAGWVTREIDPDDRRHVLVSLTEEGEKRANRLVTMKTEAEQRFFGALDRDVIERLSADLSTLLEQVDGAGSVSFDPFAQPS